MRIRKGTVVSKSGDKTVVVEVHRYRVHPKYQKQYRISKKYHAHDENNSFQVGDEVMVREGRPMSKLKRWVALPVDATPENVSPAS